MSDKKYLVFAGDGDEGYYPVADLNHLVGEMSLEDAHKTIKNHTDKSGIVAIIENGKVVERLEFFEDITNSIEGVSTKSGFEVDEYNKIYFEDTFKRYTITPDILTTIAEQAVMSEQGTFDHFDFSINGQFAIYSRYQDSEDSVRAVVSTETLFKDVATIKQGINNAVIMSFTTHRNWIAKGKPTFKATGTFSL